MMCVCVSKLRKKRWRFSFTNFFLLGVLVCRKAFLIEPVLAYFFSTNEASLRPDCN